MPQPAEVKAALTHGHDSTVAQLATVVRSHQVAAPVYAAQHVLRIACEADARLWSGVVQHGGQDCHTRYARVWVARVAHIAAEGMRFGMVSGCVSCVSSLSATRPRSARYVFFARGNTVHNVEYNTPCKSCSVFC